MNSEKKEYYANLNNKNPIFKGSGGKWNVVYNEYTHITSVRKEDNSKTLFTSKVNDLYESNANMILASCAPELLDMLIELSFICNLSYEKQKEVNDLIKKSTDI